MSDERNREVAAGSASQRDAWVEDSGPRNETVVSSRARLARNLQRHRFAPHAESEKLFEIARVIDEAIRSNAFFRAYQKLVIADVSHVDRAYLRESRLISAELEKGGENRVVYLSEDGRISIMVNEEDHLRMHCMYGGLQVESALGAIDAVDDALGESLEFAFSERFGFLTACPTNVGTGLRISVMLHLPGMVIAKSIEEIGNLVHPYGLTVRGFYGENSEFTGDFYQISNEVSLGKSEEELAATVQKVVEEVVGKEKAAREELFQHSRVRIEDDIWRAYALLSNARLMNSEEAMALLSKMRLGIDRGLFSNLTHADLNKIVLQIQPAHLQYNRGKQIEPDQRDMIRAELLRTRFQDLLSNN
jgi:protein arginine kinase